MSSKKSGDISSSTVSVAANLCLNVSARSCPHVWGEKEQKGWNWARKWPVRRQLGADGWRDSNSGRERSRKEGLRKQRWGRKGQSATRLGSHLLCASLPNVTIHQQREQGKINSSRPAKAVIPSLTDRSSQPSVSITPLFSLPSHVLLLHKSPILSISRSRLLCTFLPH